MKALVLSLFLLIALVHGFPGMSFKHEMHFNLKVFFFLRHYRYFTKAAICRRRMTFSRMGFECALLYVFRNSNEKETAGNFIK